MKTYLLQTTVTTTTAEKVTANSEEEAIANGGTNGCDVKRQVSVNRTAIEIIPSELSVSAHHFPSAPRKGVAGQTQEEE